MPTQEQHLISTIKKTLPGVVSIVVGKDYETLLKEHPSELMLPHANPTEPPVPEEALPHTEAGKVRVGGGSGFIVDPSGLILTNKHVVADKSVEYTIKTLADEAFPAHVIAVDPLNDVAILKIDAGDLCTLPLGNSDHVELGQTILAIGTALGEFQNTVSSGIVSGLSRFITAVTDLEGHSERLRGLIQTDAAINLGNSGGPLVNLKGEVIGINAATIYGAQNIGFAIPINKAHRDLEEVKTFGRIRRPFLGIRYILLNPLFQKKFRLPIDHGAYVLHEEYPGAVAVLPGSPAQKAGIQESDIILELNNTPIAEKIGIEDVLEKAAIGDHISVKLLRNGEEKMCTLIAEERK